MPETDSYRESLRARLYVCVVLVLLAVFGYFVVQNLDAPILGYTDESIHTYQGYYVLKYLHFVPWPKLDLNNNALLYPYGNDQVFQSWVFERDLFAALCNALFGLGPWVQYHYLFSLLVTALGVFHLLRREHSFRRSAFAGLAITFCNYYPIRKFPGHANLCVLHWSFLGIVADYLITRRVWRGEMPSARLLLLRVALVFLALGQEMGYVAGLSLSSFVLTAAWCAFLLWRRRERPWREVIAGWRTPLAAGMADLRARGRQTGLLLGATVWGAFFYFPLTLQVFLHARKYPVKDILVGHWWQWANPLRLFYPIVPGLEPISSPGRFDWLVENRFHDIPEGYFAMSPGLFFVLIGLLGVGLAARRKTLGALVPILVLFLLIVANHPVKFPVMSLFPWFAYVRTTAKLGNLNCLALVLLAVGGIPAGFFAAGQAKVFSLARLRQVGLVGLGLLFGTEICTAYRLQILKDRNYFRPAEEFYAFMDTIRRAPGEAILEWPFCVASGNGLGTYFFGPYFERQSTLFCLGAFHDKKVPSGYYGRLFASQVAPLYDAGWDDMFFPDSHELSLAHGQTRDFNAIEWKFFEDYFRENDFCGVLLSTEFLPGETVRQMHARFGEPTAVARAGSDGRVEFIPRPAAWPRPSDPRKGKSVAILPPLKSPSTHISFTDDDTRYYLRGGWGVQEPESRSTIARAAGLSIWKDADAPARDVTIDVFGTTFEPQRFGLRFNGRLVKIWQSPAGGYRHFRAWLPADGWRAGENDLQFDLPQAHRPPPPANPDQDADTRLLGLQAVSIDLYEAPEPRVVPER